MSYSPEFSQGGSPEETSAERATSELERFKVRFDPIFSSFIKQEIERAQKLYPDLPDFLDVGLEFAMRGGKRLRPAFMTYGYRAVGGTDEDNILLSSASVELVHTGALIHDDIMDNSDLRRGEPTVHRVFAERQNSNEQGNAIAIITGNTMLVLANKALNSFPELGERIREARKLFDGMCTDINYGQYLDMLGNKVEYIDLDLIMKIMEYKTARYTVEKPLMIGAALGGASPEVLQSFSEYAIPLGIAFQIQDDILGMFGDEEKVGKPVDSDLKEGKKTILVYRTLQQLEQAQRIDDIDRFKNILGNPFLTVEDYKWVQGLVDEIGALSYAREFAEELIIEAKEALHGVEIEEDARNYLLGIADYLLNRES